MLFDRQSSQQAQRLKAFRELLDPADLLPGHNVADLYKLRCVIAANEAIDTEDADGVDARIVLVAYPRDGSLTQPPQDPTPDQEAQGPAVDLHTLARGHRSWDTLYAIEGEGGAALLNNFLRLSPPAVAILLPVPALSRSS